MVTGRIPRSAVSPLSSEQSRKWSWSTQPARAQAKANRLAWRKDIRAKITTNITPPLSKQDPTSPRARSTPSTLKAPMRMNSILPSHNNNSLNPSIPHTLCSRPLRLLCRGSFSFKRFSFSPVLLTGPCYSIRSKKNKTNKKTITIQMADKTGLQNGIALPVHEELMKLITVFKKMHHAGRERRMCLCLKMLTLPCRELS